MATRSDRLLPRLKEDANALGALPTGVIHAIDPPEPAALKKGKWCGGLKECGQCRNESRGGRAQ
jgi:hypothetical protein